jgi:hypothetical protein
VYRINGLIDEIGVYIERLQDRTSTITHGLTMPNNYPNRDITTINGITYINGDIILNGTIKQSQLEYFPDAGIQKLSINSFDMTGLNNYRSQQNNNFENSNISDYYNNPFNYV